MIKLLKSSRTRKIIWSLLSTDKALSQYDVFTKNFNGNRKPRQFEEVLKEEIVIEKDGLYSPNLQKIAHLIVTNRIKKEVTPKLIDKTAAFLKINLIKNTSKFYISYERKRRNQIFPNPIDIFETTIARLVVGETIGVKWKAEEHSKDEQLRELQKCIKVPAEITSIDKHKKDIILDSSKEDSQVILEVVEAYKNYLSPF